MFYYDENSSLESILSEKNVLSQSQKDNVFTNKKMILHVTSHFSDDKTDLKGGYHFIELAKKLMRYEELLFVVAGNTASIGEIPSNMLVLGDIDNQRTLGQLYSCASVTVITSKRETFGMSVAESLCCGTPLVGFVNGGSDTVSISKYSLFIKEYGDDTKLAETLLKMLSEIENGKMDKKQISSCAYKMYSKK